MLHPEISRHLFHRYGGMRTVRWLRRKGATILMYHKFPADRSSLESQCEYLRKHYRVISLARLLELTRNGDPLPSNCVVITVDDGHNSFYHHAYPVFAKFAFPVVVYLTTGPIDDRGWLWFDRVAHAFIRSRLTTAELPALPGSAQNGQGTPHPVPLRDEYRRSTLANEFMAFMKTIPSKEVARQLDALEVALRVTTPDQAPAQWASLSWEQVRLMAKDQVEFGGHTVSHPILARLGDDTLVHAEIANSKARIEAELDKPILHFAYPNGQPEDIPPSAIEAVRAVGYRTATSTIVGQIFPGDDAYMLRRIPADPVLPAYEFRQHVAAFRTQ